MEAVVEGALTIQSGRVGLSEMARLSSFARILRLLTDQVRTAGRFDLTIPDPDLYDAVLKSAFVKAFEFAHYANSVTLTKADESSFFMTAGLRGICEDIITLKFINQFDPPIRREIILMEMVSTVSKASEAQNRFFKKIRPFQPLVTFAPDPAKTQERRDRYRAIGLQTGLKMIQEKLPPVEQMAMNVGMAEVYDFFYRISSETVHFNVRVALRNGWGLLDMIEFGTKKFCKYYLEANQVYGIYLFSLLCETFHSQLGLDDKFMERLKRISLKLSRELRWPEPVTFEEMNARLPNPILRSVLFVAHMDKHDKAFMRSLDRRTRRKKSVR
jgi:hypothetical protein